VLLSTSIITVSTLTDRQKLRSYDKGDKVVAMVLIKGDKVQKTSKVHDHRRKSDGGWEYQLIDSKGTLREYEKNVTWFPERQLRLA